MSIFISTAKQKVKVYEIAAEMKVKNLSVDFISACVEQALTYEGTHDLMVLWSEASNSEEKDEILADLQEEIDLRVEAPKKPVRKPYIKYEDLDLVARDVMGFKKKLRIEVDRQGGISVLAKKTGIPQPSLSRFFSSASMPRRTTLYKIANALKLDERSVATEWVA